MIANRIRLVFLIGIFVVGAGADLETATAQEAIEHLGLSSKNITSLSVNYGIIAAGTDREGVYWQQEFSPSSSGWTNAGLDTLVIRAVYAHKSGPIGWAISAGVYPDEKGDPFIYCSYMGGAFEARSHGIDNALTTGIDEIDGFPDMTICGETYAAGGRGLYLRNFADTTWKPVYTAGHDGHVQTVKVRTEYPGVVLAGGGEGFAGFLLVKSVDFGQTWKNISPPTTVQSVDFSGTNADVIFAAGTSTIHRSMDGGANWSIVWSGDRAHFLAEIAYDPGSGYVYAAGSAAAPNTTGLLLVSTDQGTSWRSVAPAVGPVVGLALSADWTYFATVNDGVFRFRKTAVGTESPAPDDYALHQNYPNPTSGVTTIRYSLSHPGSTTLAVYDILGKEVAKLVSGRQPAGEFEVVLDATALPAGLYTYVLTAGELRDARRLIVLR